MRTPVLFLLLICYLKCINFNYKADLAYDPYDPLSIFEINGSTESLEDNLASAAYDKRCHTDLDTEYDTHIQFSDFFFHFFFSIFQFEIKVLMFL